MWESAIVYAGVTTATVGCALMVKPRRWLPGLTRARGLVIAAAGVALAAIGLALPVSESRIARIESRLDEFVPAWQFHEIHTIRIAASPSRVYDAIRKVRADEISLFRTLTWIRRGGQELPPSILNAGNRESLIDVATANGFVRLVDEAPRELVIGTVVLAPPGLRGTLTSQVFQAPLPSGFAIAVMNFAVTEDGPDRSFVSTETRVFASSAAARRRFAAYWRVIYPGSAIIRRMWLQAIERRATHADSARGILSEPALAGR